MTRYTICFDEEKEAHILRWMDEQANKGRSLKALVERSIAQEGYTDIFSLAWQRNIRNSTQMLDEPVKATTEYNVQRPKKKRGRPQKKASSPSHVSASAISETDDAEQSEGHMLVDSASTTQSGIQQSMNTVLSSSDNPASVSISEMPAEPDRGHIPDNQSVAMENQFPTEDISKAEAENDGYRRPGNVDFDMAKFMG